MLVWCHTGIILKGGLSWHPQGRGGHHVLPAEAGRVRHLRVGPGRHARLDAEQEEALTDPSDPPVDSAARLLQKCWCHGKQSQTGQLSSDGDSRDVTNRCSVSGDWLVGRGDGLATSRGATGWPGSCGLRRVLHVLNSDSPGPGLIAVGKAADVAGQAAGAGNSLSGSPEELHRKGVHGAD